jgi:hypothetical protein
MSVRSLRVLVGACLLLAACGRGGRDREPTQVLVVGTIHGSHRSNPNYSYEHLVQILATYGPDAICVEIRPEDFRRVPYLTEMVAATIYGAEHGTRVYPIDWWDERNNARAERDAFMQTPEYAAQQPKEAALEAADSVIQGFEARYGDWQTYSRTGSYVFFNGPDYNDYIAEGYRISMEVWGDGPMNLYYRTRNDRMMERIRGAIRENRGRKVIVLTGAEHKHYFDRALAAEPGVQLVGIGAVLPLKPVSVDPAIQAYLAQNRAYGYFDLTAPQGADLYYAGVLVVLLHGPDMDFDPARIPSENVVKARSALDEWQQVSPDSPLLQFELGWQSFLASAPAEALAHYERALANLEKIVPEQRDFVRRVIHRNMGFCYDLLGDRERAVAAYDEGERQFDAMNGPAWQREPLFRSYRTTPFRMERRASAP